MWNVFSPDSELGALLEKVFNLLILNLLTVLCCIPVVTIGAALTASMSTCFQMQEGSVAVCKTFFKEFRSNFKKSTLIWIVAFLIMQLLAVNYVILLKTQPELGGIAEIALIILAVLTAMSIKWSCGLQAYFTNTAWQTAKNSVLLSLGYLHYSIAMLLVDCIPVVLFLLVDSNVAFFAAVLYGVAAPGYVGSLLMKKVFLKLQEQETQKEE